MILTTLASCLQGYLGSFVSQKDQVKQAHPDTNHHNKIVRMFTGVKLTHSALNKINQDLEK